MASATEQAADVEGGGGAGAVAETHDVVLSVGEKGLGAAPTTTHGDNGDSGGHTTRDRSQPETQSTPFGSAGVTDSAGRSNDASGAWHEARAGAGAAAFDEQHRYAAGVVGAAGGSGAFTSGGHGGGARHGSVPTSTPTPTRPTNTTNTTNTTTIEFQASYAMGGMCTPQAPRFVCAFPAELRSRVHEQEFLAQMDTFNAYLKSYHMRIRQIRAVPWGVLLLGVVLVVMAAIVAITSSDGAPAWALAGGVPLVVLGVLGVHCFKKRAGYMVEACVRALRSHAQRLNSTTYSQSGVRWAVDSTTTSVVVAGRTRVFTSPVVEVSVDTRPAHALHFVAFAPAHHSQQHLGVGISESEDELAPSLVAQAAGSDPEGGLAGQHHMYGRHGSGSGGGAGGGYGAGYGARYGADAGSQSDGSDGLGMRGGHEEEGEGALRMGAGMGAGMGYSQTPLVRSMVTPASEDT